MPGRKRSRNAIRRWRQLHADIKRAIAGLRARDLDRRSGDEGMSIRETVHHLVEANLVASSMIILALAKSGSVYDWSWLYPDAAWTRSVGYNAAPLRPVLATLEALSEHIAGLIERSPGSLARSVQLLDAPGAKLYSKTVEEILWQEVEHAEEHLRDVAAIRSA
ncbi:MAG TPA: hypothetical protein VIL97_01405 [Thermoanaerobaculia bacterium]